MVLKHWGCVGQMEYKYRRPWSMCSGFGSCRWSTNIVDDVPQPLRHTTKERKIDKCDTSNQSSSSSNT